MRERSHTTHPALNRTIQRQYSCTWCTNRVGHRCLRRVSQSDLKTDKDVHMKVLRYSRSFWQLLSLLARRNQTSWEKHRHQLPILQPLLHRRVEL